jgi:hypothetical protein
MENIMYVVVDKIVRDVNKQEFFKINRKVKDKLYYSIVNVMTIRFGFNKLNVNNGKYKKQYTR